MKVTVCYCLLFVTIRTRDFKKKLHSDKLLYIKKMDKLRSFMVVMMVNDKCVDRLNEGLLLKQVKPGSPKLTVAGRRNVFTAESRR